MDSTNVDKEGTESGTNADKKMSGHDDAEDPKVAGAMGFSDDEAKSGDVGKVLDGDAIQPNRQQ